MARVTVTSKASATASLPPGRLRVRTRSRRLASFPVIRRRWIRCAPTSTAKTSPRRMWIVRIGSKASETTAVEIKPRCTHHRYVLFRATTPTARACHAIEEHVIRYYPDRTPTPWSSGIARSVVVLMSLADRPIMSGPERGGAVRVLARRVNAHRWKSLASFDDLGRGGVRRHSEGL